MGLSPFDKAVEHVKKNALENREREPSLTYFESMTEEFLELVQALKGKHEDPPEHELAQIGGIAINWLADLIAKATITDRKSKP